MTARGASSWENWKELLKARRTVAQPRLISVMQVDLEDHS